ncbi:MAG: putative manganese transporter [bacterium]|nr:putative manganese transporter [bacterium]
MLEIIIDTIKDGIKLLPFLLIAFIIIEYFEHKFTNNSKKIIKKSGKFGPLFGSLLGLIPQCGFSVLATNLYITKIVSLGTLISIYLSTSDEMLPILISQNVSTNIIIKILLVKFLVGMISGFLIDLIFRKHKEKEDYSICNTEHCHCHKESILLSACNHTFKILGFIVIVSFILNLLLYYLGSDFISNTFMKESLLSPFISSLIGLIPNCASSVVLTELFVNDVISFSSLIAGLLTGSGVAILVLFRSNKNLKENLFILTLIYLIGSISGFIIELFSLI